MRSAESGRGWPHDLLVAFEASTPEGRCLEVIDFRDGQVAGSMQFAVGLVVSPRAPRRGTRRGDGELAGQFLLAPGADVSALVPQTDKLRHVTCIDVAELAATVLPTAPQDPEHLLSLLGSIATPPADVPIVVWRTREIFLGLVERLLELDLPTLQLMVRLGAPTDWALHPLIAEVERLARQRGDALAAGRGFSIADLPTVTRPLPEPLPPSGKSRPVSIQEVRRALSGGGAIAGQLEHFESRPSQIEMLETVTEVMNDGGHALVEAGTGTGKSFAYLVPSILYAARNGRRVVVSTATINLQDQLFHSDVPRVVAGLQADIRCGVVKGRANYLCLRRWSQLLNADMHTDAERTLLIKTLLWLPQTETGDRSELRLSATEEQAWSRLCALTEACTPMRCQYHRAGVCFLARARKNAEASHLVIINHALLLTDALNQAHVLPDFDHLVIDEGHHLEDEATAQLGWSVTGRELARHLETLLDSASGPGIVRQALEILRRVGSPLSVNYGDAERRVRRCRETIDELLDVLGSFLRHHGQAGDGGQVTLRLTDSSRSQPDWSHVEIVWDGLARSLNGLAQIITQVVNALEQHTAQREDASEIAGALATEADFWDAARTQLGRALGERGSDPITWLTRGRGDDLSICLAPLEVGELLAKMVFRNKACVVVTSATLTTAGKFEYVRSRLGLEETRDLRVASPFDYARAALVCAPSDVPEPTQPNYQSAVEWIIERIVSRVRGRTLVLFTSYSQLRTTHAALSEPLAEKGILLLAQGIDAGSRETLLQSFRSRQPAVLLGTNSFWEGVDVVGDALSCVIIPRLPFSVPTDPVFQARSELFEQPFRDYAVPQAILRFRQGFGRLIRSQRDRGALVILDRRVLSKSYGGIFLKSLPEARLDTGSGRSVADRIADWLAATEAGVS